jgi:hypothetical protein
LSDDELTGKLLSAAEPYLSSAAAGELADRCWEFDRLADVSDVLRPFNDRVTAAT